MAKIKKEEQEQKVVIPPLEKRIVKITIEGITPLLVNRCGHEATSYVRDKSNKVAKNKKEMPSIQEQFESSLYKMDNGKYGVPASALKRCAVSACRFVDGMPMTVSRGAFHVLQDPYVEIKGSKPVIDERTERLQKGMSKIPVPRIRGRFDKWEITFDVLFNPTVISPSQLFNLYENAGFSVGLCERRPEKGGSLGQFSVKRG